MRPGLKVVVQAGCAAAGTGACRLGVIGHKKPNAARVPASPDVVGGLVMICGTVGMANMIAA
jgi:hypothetical protein